MKNATSYGHSSHILKKDYRKHFTEIFFSFFSFFAKKTIFKDVQERQQAQHSTKGKGNVEFQCKTLTQHNWEIRQKQPFHKEWN